MQLSTRDVTWSQDVTRVTRDITRRQRKISPAPAQPQRDRALYIIYHDVCPNAQLPESSFFYPTTWHPDGQLCHHLPNFLSVRKR